MVAARDVCLGMAPFSHRLSQSAHGQRAGRPLQYGGGLHLLTRKARMPHELLLDIYETEILKITGIWAQFPESAMDYRPHAKSRSVIEQMEHQVQSEGRWMKTMLSVDTGNPNPPERTGHGFLAKYREDAY